MQYEIDINRVICPGCGVENPELDKYGDCTACDFGSGDADRPLNSLAQILSSDEDFHGVALGKFLRTLLSIPRANA